MNDGQLSDSVNRDGQACPTDETDETNRTKNPIPPVDHADVPNATPRTTRLTEGFEALSRPLEEGMTP